jgi:hypothetical protein
MMHFLKIIENYRTIDMKFKGLTKVEQTFFKRSGRKEYSTKVPYIIVNNLPNLGLLTSLRFLEWAAENQEGVISLPTGKTPAYRVEQSGKPAPYGGKRFIPEKKA